jgi:hypothetical protein
VHDVLVALYPSQPASLDSQLNTDLARIAAGARLTRGLQAGAAAAQAILANRAKDGSALTPPPYTLAPGPGIFEPIAPATAVFTHWSSVKPFVLTRANEFRPPAPPPLSSPAYLQTVQQVESLGQSSSTTRTPDQTTIATFWGGASGTTGMTSPRAHPSPTTTRSPKTHGCSQRSTCPSRTA